MQHPAVSDVAVIGVPDKVRGSVVKACVVVKEQYSSHSRDSLAKQIQSVVKRVLAAHMSPRIVQFLPALPKGPSGKTLRMVLRQRHTQKLQQ